MAEIRIPDLSLIITTYNRLPLLQEAIASFNGQLHCAAEILIVDDGSTDGTVEFLGTLGDPFRIFLCEHKGVQNSRNVALRAARGKYLKYLDDDDVLEPMAVAAQVDYMEQHPHIDVCYSDWGFLARFSDKPERRWFYIMDQIVDPITSFISDWWCAPFVYLFRRSSVQELVWHETPVFTDFIFLADVVLRGAQFGYLPTSPIPLGWYRDILPTHKRLSKAASVITRAKAECHILNHMEQSLKESNALTDERRKAFSKRYFRIAQRIYNYDRVLFRELVRKVFELEPDYLVEGKRYQRMVRLFGYERAEGVRQLSHKLRAQARQFVRRQVQPDNATNQITYLRPKESTIIPKH